MSESKVYMDITKLTKRMVRYDAPEGAFPPAVQNIYIEKSALTEFFDTHGTFPQQISVTVSW